MPGLLRYKYEAKLTMEYIHQPSVDVEYEVVVGRSA